LLVAEVDVGGVEEFSIHNTYSSVTIAQFGRRCFPDRLT
jgi:hypothetical protein